MVVLIRFCILCTIPIVMFSSIPAIYPLYKHILAPHLPLSVQKFFSDIRSILLTFVNLLFSGEIFNGSSPSNTPVALSLEDWVYTYLRHCTINKRFLFLHSLCRTCQSPSAAQILRAGTEDFCTACDLCLVEPSAMSSHSSYDEDGCFQILHDVLQIMQTKNTPYQSMSFADVMKECGASFLLYLRFSIHILVRFSVHFLVTLFQGIKHIIFFYSWMTREITTNLHSNHLHAAAIAVILVFTSLLLLYMLRLLVRIVTLVLRMLRSVLTADSRGKSRHRLLSAHLHGAKAPEAPFSRLHVPQQPSRSHLAEKSLSTETEEELGVLASENKELAKLVEACLDDAESFDALIRVLEVLYSGE